MLGSSEHPRATGGQNRVISLARPADGIPSRWLALWAAYSMTDCFGPLPRARSNSPSKSNSDGELPRPTESAIGPASMPRSRRVCGLNQMGTRKYLNKTIPWSASYASPPGNSPGAGR